MTTFAYVSIYLHMCKFAYRWTFGHVNASTYMSKHTHICNSKLFACGGCHMQINFYIYAEVFSWVFRNIFGVFARHVYAMAKFAYMSKIIPKISDITSFKLVISPIQLHSVILHIQISEFSYSNEWYRLFDYVISLILQNMWCHLSKYNVFDITFSNMW